MELHADDAGFVRVSAEVVDTTIVDVEGWGRWWPGIRLVARPTPTSDLLWLVELRRGVARRFRYELVRRQYRPAKGIEFALRGDLVGRAEFWYEPVTGGTVVHHLLAARTTLSRPGAVLRDYRRAVRRALAGLKDEVEMAQRVVAGLPP